MKLKSYIYSFVAGTLMLAACSPDEHNLGEMTYVADDLVQGIAFSVTPDAADPNTIHLKSLVKGVTPLWETPQGRSQKENMTIQLPFAGDYNVTFGVMTPAGSVYGDPYQFNVSQNNFGMLEDEIWSNLAGGVGKSRKWIPIDKNYGIGRCTGPVMYMSPDDVKNDGSASKDLMFGSENWTPNWDPGIQSWLIPAGDPYFNSYMTFGLDAQNGCTAEVFRNDANGGTLMNGKFSLNISDPKRPVITFDKCYALHNAGFDEVCANYTVDIKILECTPYLLQLATMRTNNEGPWWLVWNFISEEAYNDPSIIPTEDAGLLGTTPVQEPTYANLEEDLFRIAGSGAYYVGTATTYLMNEDAPYDWYWWNAASAVWESNGFDSADDYGKSWAPAYTGAGDFVMNLSTTATAGTYNCDIELADTTFSSTFVVKDNKLVFEKEVALMLIPFNEKDTIKVAGKEFTVMKISADDSQVVLGVPAGKDATGAVNKYLCANLTIKPITSDNGPVEVKVDNSVIKGYFETNENAYQYRIDIYNPWGGDTYVPMVDITKMKLKKNQKLVIKLKVSGIQWKEDATPKLAISDNIIVNAWGANVFAHPTAINIPADDSEKTIELVNNTGKTVNFEGTSCVSVCILVDDMAEGPLDAEGNFDASQVTAEVTSITIHTIQ